MVGASVSDINIGFEVEPFKAKRRYISDHPKKDQVYHDMFRSPILTVLGLYLA